MKFYKKIVNLIISKNNEKEINTVDNQDYFSQAKSWSDEFYASAVLSRNKWRALSLFVLLPILFLFLIWITFLIPSQHLEPLMINHYRDGETIVTPLKQHYAPDNSAEVESDIAKYIRFRESYSADTYDYAYRLVHLMSSGNVYNGYQALQSITNKNAPINILGKSGYDTVKIESIVFLDNENKNSHKKSNNKNNSHQSGDIKKSNLHSNLAQVDFVVTTHNKETNTTTSLPLTAVLSWKYRGISNDPNLRWMDWNGFMVTDYQITQRNV